MSVSIFQPNTGNTATIAVTSTTASVALNGSPITVRVYNSGTVTVFIQFGTSTVTATTSNMPIAPGIIEAFGLPSGTTHVAAITTLSTATIYFTTGEGA